MSKIDSILLSGNPYDIQDKEATKVVNVTQAEYDALVSGGTVDPTTLYNITDATPIDLSNYWTSAQTESAITDATSGKVDTSAVTSSITSGSTNSEIPSAKAVYDVLPTTTSAVTSGSTAVVESGGVYEQLGGLKLIKLTQSAYDALSPNYDSNTIYFIKD